MAIKVSLIFSVILQFAAAIIALSLIKRTRTNIAWWLISAGFLLMAFRRVFEVLQIYDSQSVIITGLLGSWTGILISVIMLLSLIFIKRIFNIQEQIENLRKQNENRVLSAILKTEEKERQHFSKELHDGLGPLLSSIKMSISTSRYHKNNQDEILVNAEKLIDESIQTLRNISNNLSPHILIDFGLLKAVKSFIDKLQLIEEPTITLNSNLEEKRFPFNVEVVLYRVICELISNTLKHANAKTININLNYENNTVSLKYIDDGKGFNEESVKKEMMGMGYSNLRTRIKSLNGSYSIITNPGEGVIVDAEILLS